MFQSRLFHSTLREASAEAEVASHQLLLRGGYIRPVASGIYTYTPLGLRVLRHIEQIVRLEMDLIGAQEVLMPVLQPVDLWKESGRFEHYGPELMTVEDRHQRSFALGPTHEEVITALVKQEISSYRKLPAMLYQIQTKFRDERRPRFGLLRGREFLMKDAYSFDTNWEGLDEAYQRMRQAYEQIFSRLHINFRTVEADGGTIGGEGGTHEFMALASIGEDTIACCERCEYAANVEKAEVIKPFQEDKPAIEKLNYGINALYKVHTPAIHSIEALSTFLNIEASNILKTLIYMADGKPVAVVINGQYEVNELKVKNMLQAEHIELADTDYVKHNLNTTIGFIGPIGLDIPILYDYSIAFMSDAVAGANIDDYHLQGIHVAQHLRQGKYGDFRNVVVGDDCPRCHDGKLVFHRGIEMGHIFKLGTKYSTAMKASFINAHGEAEPLIMGCYGIGISRLLAAIVEQHHQDSAITWPNSVAPYLVHIIVIAIDDKVQQSLLERFIGLRSAELLIDDRDERAGVKFKDADLIGIPYRIVIGKQASEGLIEWFDRHTSIKEAITVEQAIKRIKVQEQILIGQLM